MQYTEQQVKDVLKTKVKSGEYSLEEAKRKLDVYRNKVASETLPETPTEDMNSEMIQTQHQPLQTFGAPQQELEPATFSGTVGTQGPRVYTPEDEPSLMDNIKELFTGDLRSTPEIEALPDYDEMYVPEMITEMGVGSLPKTPQEATLRKGVAQVQRYTSPLGANPKLELQLAQAEPSEIASILVEKL